MDRKAPHLQHGVQKGQLRHAVSVAAAVVAVVAVVVALMPAAVAIRSCHIASVPAKWNNNNQTCNLTEWKWLTFTMCTNKTMMLDI